MPETALNLNDSFQTREHKVGLAREIRHVQPVPVSHSVDHSPHQEFRQSAPASNPAHVRRTALRFYCIHHRAGASSVLASHRLYPA